MFYWQNQVILPWDIMESSAKYGVVHMMLLAKITQIDRTQSEYFPQRTRSLLPDYPESLLLHDQQSRWYLQ